MPTAPFNSLYTPFGSPCRGQKRRSEPFYSMVGGPLEVYASSKVAVFCAGRTARIDDAGCLLDVDGTAGTHYAGRLLIARC